MPLGAGVASKIDEGAFALRMLCVVVAMGVGGQVDDGSLDLRRLWIVFAIWVPSQINGGALGLRAGSADGTVLHPKT